MVDEFFRIFLIEKFIQVLFDSFERIVDEEIFKAVVSILVQISNEAKDIGSNLVIKVCLKHPN